MDANITPLKGYLNLTGTAVARPLFSHKSSQRRQFTTFMEKVQLKAINTFSQMPHADESSLYTRIGKKRSNEQRSQIDFLFNDVEEPAFGYSNTATLSSMRYSDHMPVVAWFASDQCLGSVA